MDRQLLEKAKNNDARAFEELLLSCRKLIIRTCRHYMTGLQDTEDAVIESEVRLWKALDSYVYDETFEGFVFRIVKNVCLTMLEKGKAEKRGGHMTILSLEGIRAGKDDDLPFDPPDPRQNVEDRVVEKENRAYLRECMMALPEDQHTALVLTQLEGIPYARAAEILHISEGTVKSQVNRARSKLRKMITGHDSDPDREEKKTRERRPRRHEQEKG